jgi:hypothetical protein
MATRAGMIWRYGDSGMPGVVKLLPTQTGTVPIAGDICNNDADGRPVVLPDSANDDAGEELILRYLCLGGSYAELDVMDKPGYVAGTSGPATANFGGYGSRESVADRAIAGKRLHFLPITDEFRWVINRDDADAVEIGTRGGLDRVAANDYRLNVDVTAPIVEVVGFYSPDVDDGTTLTPTPQVWVKAVTPGGYL